MLWGMRSPGSGEVLWTDGGTIGIKNPKSWMAVVAALVSPSNTNGRRPHRLWRGPESISLVLERQDET